MRTALTRAFLLLALLIGALTAAVPVQTASAAAVPVTMAAVAERPAPVWDVEILASGCGSRCDFKPTSYNHCGSTCPDGIPIPDHHLHDALQWSP